MRNIINSITIVLAFMPIVYSSCIKKTWVCECQYKSGGVQTFTINNSSKKDAKKICSDIEAGFSSGANNGTAYFYGGLYNCKIK
jgi:hypothetical protein